MLKPFDLQALFIFLCIKVALVTEPEAGEYLTYPIPLWEVDLFYYVSGEDYARFMAGYMLDEDGNILAERDSETRIFK